MKKDIAYIKDVEVKLDFFGVYHDVKSKLNIGVKLNPKERSFFLLYATEKEKKEFLKNEGE